MKKKVALAILACVILVIVAAIAFTVGKNSNNKPSFEEDITIKATNKGTIELQKDWTDWSDKLPDYINEDDHIVEEKVLYRSRNIETTSSSSSTLSGWELYDSKAEYSDYGDWSAWSTYSVVESNCRDVEIKKQYSYRLKNAETQYSSWSDWSDWSSTPVKSDDLTRVETRTVGGKVKQYRYSTRTVNNGNSFTNWSEYSDVAIEPSENREVRTRTVYRYRDREENIVYYFKRWGEWSDWSTTAVSASDEVKVETKTQYRYKSN